MKLTAIITLVATLQVSAGGFSQTVSLNYKNAPVKKVFKEIIRQTGVSLIYSEANVKDLGSVTVSVKDVQLEAALEQILKDRNVKFRIINNTVIVEEMPVMTAPPVSNIPPPLVDIVVTGTVTDESNVPVAKASIVVKGTTKGTTTDNEGKFSISVPEHATLIISAIGYAEQQIAITGNTLKVVLKTAVAKIDEVVVVAFGTQKKINLSGSVNTVNVGQITDRSVTSLTNSLQGLIPGVTILSRPGDVGGDMGSINIRGRGNLGGSGPFYVVDGMPVNPGDFARINPGDVESISILKDASAASLYGSRAANGVILVTTKKGKNGKATVSYNGYYGMQKATVLPNWLGSYDYAVLSNEAAKNGGGSLLPFSDARLEMIKNQSSPDSFPNNDWYKLALREVAPITQHEISVSGGGTTRYYFSGTYFNQGSLIPDKDLKRYSFRANVESQVSDKFKIGTNIAYISDNINSSSGSLSFVSLNRVVPLLVNKQSNGQWGSINGGKIDATLAADNPVRKLQEGGRNSSAGSRFIGNLNATFTPVKSVNIKGLFGYNAFNYFGSEFVNRLDPIPNFITGAPLTSTAVAVNQLTQNWQTTYRLIDQLTADYEKYVKNHYGKILLGTSYERNQTKTQSLTRKDFVTNELNAPDAGSADPLNTSASGGIFQDGLFSLFGRFNYNYSEKYFFEANYRVDESSKFAPGHRKGYYPSFSAAWRISKENFFSQTNWLSDLKIRGSWGKLGNITNVGNYDFFDGLPSGTIGILDEKQQDGVSPGKLANPTLSWEKVTMTNIGLDAGFFKNRLSLQVDLFNKVTNDILLTNQAIPDESGLSGAFYPVQNLGRVQNKGIELVLNYSDRIGDFKYSIGGNLSTIKNKILTLGNGANTDMYDGNYINRIGQSVGSFYLLQADGLFVSNDEVAKHATQFAGTRAGDIKYVNQNKANNSVTTDDDRIIAGNDVPYFTYGLNASASYKNFDFSIIGQGIQNVSVYLDGEASQAFFNGAGVKRYVLGRWTTANPNPNASYPRVLRSAANSHNLKPSTFWLFDADYFRVKAISLGYSIPEAAIKKTGIKGLRVYLSGNNMFTIRADKRMKDFDVEAPSSRASYPQLKSFSFGVNLNL